MKFSVIIPYYKAINTIGRTLESIYRQTYSDFEIILVNDLSPDNPNTIIDEYKSKFIQRDITLRYIELEKNSGPSKARNIAWDNASGDYIAFLDSDDFWHPNKLQICANFISDEIIMLYHAAEITIEKYLDKINFQSYVSNQFNCHKKSNLSWFKKNHSVTPAVIIKRDISCRFDENIKYSEDYELWLRIAFKYNNTYSILGPPLTYLGKPFSEGNSLSSNITKMRIGEMKLFIQFCFSNLFYLPLLPFLLIYSTLKHIRLLTKNIF